MTKRNSEPGAGSFQICRGYRQGSPEATHLFQENQGRKRVPHASKCTELSGQTTPVLEKKSGLNVY